MDIMNAFESKSTPWSWMLAMTAGALFISPRSALAQDAPPNPTSAESSVSQLSSVAVATPATVPSSGSAAPQIDGSDNAYVRSAGYRNGTFYIHSPDEVFRLYIQGRVHADWLEQTGPGTSKLPAGSGVTDGFGLRRARLELGGEFFETWQWLVGAEFATFTSIDNAAGNQTTPTCSVSAATGAVTCANKTNPVENATVKPIPTDVFVNYAPTPWFNVQVGQFYLPFTLENRISDNTTPFLERSLAVRNIGAPLQRDIGAMAWGESPDKVLYYAVALLNGDGPNRTNTDARYDVSGRVFARPFALTETSSLRWAQIGASARYGSRDPKLVGYDLPSLTTQGGFPFWKPTYSDSLGRTIHIIPARSQWAVGADAYIPVDRFDVAGEFIYSQSGTREAVDGYQLSPFVERQGNLHGYGWYVEAGYWILGDRDILGTYPSYGRPLHVDLNVPQKPASHALEVLAKVEQLSLTYDGAAENGGLDPNTPNGDIRVYDVEFGVNYWATKHMRVGLNYTHSMFPDATPVTPSATGGPRQSSLQRAVSPAQALAKGTEDSARNGSGTLEEVQARFGVQF